MNRKEKNITFTPILLNMYFKMKKIILVLASCSILASCVKDEDKEPIDVSKVTYLMDGKWQLKMSTMIPDITDPAAVPVDLYYPLIDCIKDNHLEFKSGSDVTEYENIRCNNQQFDLLDMKYSLEQNQQYLKIWLNPDDPDNSIFLAGDISYPSIDTFVVTYLGTNPDDETLTARFTKTYVKFR